MKDTTSKPFFSIVIPTLNEEKLLPLLLEDLEKQTYSDFEVIVVDAQSKDKTKKVAEKFREKFKNLEILESPKKNVSFQRNSGAKRARAKWIIFMDADNRIPRNFLEELKNQIRKFNPDILSTWMKPDTKNTKDKLIATLINLFIELKKATKTPSILEAFICIKKSSFYKLKGFKESVRLHEGPELMKRAIKNKMKFVFLKKPSFKTSFRRIHKEGASKLYFKFILLEAIRLLDKKSYEKMARTFYPLEGGSFYKPPKNNKKIKKIISEIRKKLKEHQNKNP